MGVKIKKKIFGKETRYFCDRCGQGETADWSDFFILCETCYSIDPRSIRPQLIKSNKDYGFSDPRPEHVFCSVCYKILGDKVNFESIKCHHICRACISTHPDKTHFRSFDQQIDYFLNQSVRNTTLVRNCSSCGGVLVIDIVKSQAMYKYFKVGTKKSSEDPFSCTKERADQEHCVHDWTMLSGSEQNKGASLEKIRAIRNHPDPLTQMTFSSYLTDQRHWCYKCGLFYQIPSERLPSKGYL